MIVTGFAEGLGNMTPQGTLPRNVTGNAADISGVCSIRFRPIIDTGLVYWWAVSLSIDKWLVYQSRTDIHVKIYLFNVHVYLTVTAPRTWRFRQYL